MNRREFVGAWVTAGLSLAVDRAGADTPFPSRPVRIIVPFGPGGPTDVVARIIGDAMAAKWPVPVIVENRPGAGTLVGTAEVARAKPDGHTIGIVVSAHVVNPAIRKTMPYDTLSDLRGLTQIAEAHMVVVAHPSFPADDIPSFVRYAGTQGEPIAYATPGAGTAVHMAAELLQKAAGIRLLHVPYNGSAKAITDVLPNRVPLLFDVWHSVQPQVAEGKLKVLGVTNATRIPNAPQYALIGEAYPGYEASSLFGLVVAGQTPQPIVDRLSTDLRALIRSEAFRTRTDGLGMTPVGSTPGEFDDVVRREITKWREIAQKIGLSIE